MAGRRLDAGCWWLVVHLLAGVGRLVIAARAGILS